MILLTGNIGILGTRSRKVNNNIKMWILDEHTKYLTIIYQSSMQTAQPGATKTTPVSHWHFNKPLYLENRNHIIVMQWCHSPSTATYCTMVTIGCKVIAFEVISNKLQWTHSGSAVSKVYYAFASSCFFFDIRLFLMYTKKNVISMDSSIK